MNECSTFIPTTFPDKLLNIPRSPISSTKNPISLVWIFPYSFIMVNPELSLFWMHLGEKPINIDWEIEYRYFYEESCLGYFDDEGMPIISFDLGISELHRATLKTEGIANKEIIQRTLPYKLIKKDRNPGTFVEMKAWAKTPLEEVLFLSAEIKFKEYPRVVEPVGRKRTHKKRRYDEDPYPYDS